MLHGAGLDRAGASWHPILPRLAEARRVLAPDLPGHGETASQRPFRGIGDLARWLLSFLDMLDIDRAVVTGVSMGGAVALRVALDAPDRIAGVVPVASYGLALRAALHPLLHAGTRLPLARLTDPLIARSPIAARLALRSLIHDPDAITPEIVAELCAIAAETGSEHAFDRFLETEIERDRFRTFLTDELRQLAVPAHFIHGTHDMSIPVEAAREAAQACNAPLTELDAGHWPMFEAPDAFMAAVGPFLDRVAP